MVQWLGFCAPEAGGLGSIPGEGSRPHNLQLNIPEATTKLKNPSATTNTWCSQINVFFKKIKFIGTQPYSFIYILSMAAFIATLV